MLQGILVLGVAALLFTLLFSVRGKSRIRLILSSLAALGILFLALYWLTPDLPERPQAAEGEALVEEAPIFDYRIAPIGDPPQELFWLVISVLIVAAVVLSTWLLIGAFRKTHEEDPLAREAEAALQAFMNGENLRDVIIRCYLQMEQSVRESLSIEREGAVTPREFEEFLISRGIPCDPVHQLTRLFEKVRYSHLPTAPQDEQDAVTCLSAIRASFHHDIGGA